MIPRVIFTLSALVTVTNGSGSPQQVSMVNYSGQANADIEPAVLYDAAIGAWCIEKGFAYAGSFQAQGLILGPAISFQING
jgi:hypothetical protein